MASWQRATEECEGTGKLEEKYGKEGFFFVTARKRQVKEW
jgi:hypothetical protein